MKWLLAVLSVVVIVVAVLGVTEWSDVAGRMVTVWEAEQAQLFRKA